MKPGYHDMQVSEKMSTIYETIDEWLYYYIFWYNTNKKGHTWIITSIDLMQVVAKFGSLWELFPYASGWGSGGNTEVCLKAGIRKGEMKGNVTCFMLVKNKILRKLYKRCCVKPGSRGCTVDILRGTSSSRRNCLDKVSKASSKAPEDETGSA